MSATRPHSRIRKSGRRAMLAADHHECVYCGAKDNLTIDHLIPVSKGGSYKFRNMVTACRSCNSKRGCDDVDVTTLRFGRFRMRVEGVGLIVRGL